MYSQSLTEIPTLIDEIFIAGMSNIELEVLKHSSSFEKQKTKPEILFMLRKKITWVTPDWFVAVDLPIVPHLSKYYDITWIIIFPWRNCRYTEQEISSNQSENLKIHFYYLGSVVKF